MNTSKRWRVLEWIYYITAILSAEAAWTLFSTEPQRAWIFIALMVGSIAMALWRRSQRLKSSSQQ